MSNATDKIRKTKKNVLERYEWDDNEGNKLVMIFFK